jgi:hypothetical protein
MNANREASLVCLTPARLVPEVNAITFSRLVVPRTPGRPACGDIRMQGTLNYVVVDSKEGCISFFLHRRRTTLGSLRTLIA